MSDIKRYKFWKYHPSEIKENSEGEWVKHKDHLKAIEELKAQVERYMGVMSDVQNDLVQRADLKGEYHVGLSCSVWMALCECLPQPQQVRIYE